MGMVIQGVELNQAQLDAIVPVLNTYKDKARINKRQIEQDCLEAMAKAGYPLELPEAPAGTGEGEGR